MCYSLWHGSCVARVRGSVCYHISALAQRAHPSPSLRVLGGGGGWRRGSGVEDGDRCRCPDGTFAQGWNVASHSHQENLQVWRLCSGATFGLED
ncbi:hypothetical protein chiPu_0006227 [Chiloscyllium punctatum]|uniref:Uncharacterized protein n=1 Tax=Chiloscyllium punctatum TaxID=137246 RepID=A0A401SBN0_CHIPU|nr:hypothetical protein [Chiloscyllium punctatum]